MKTNQQPYEEMQKASGLRVGDKVRISRTAGRLDQGWDNVWIIEMNDCVGKIGTIAGINSFDGVMVIMAESTEMYGFPYFVLEKVEADLTACAVEACVAIFDNYDCTDITYAGQSVQTAWDIGRELSAARAEENAK